MSRKSSNGEDIAVIITLLLGVIASIWIWTSAPCGLWSWGKVGDMPARCLNK
ncbi:hypothetical protein P1P75_00960 [Streptomyces sp. ID05-39B]|uniref:hypothetical protein n=1 Tax=Streptomyces sp. ID05-39B TaxID=3028664 RepID=UPI0029BE2866|nr:hypothetical protein [Streptomyces sp. ID05-39B]MDX3525058.1 hypothetical protein [Streptomyces sp. ID05-39B]